MNKLSELSKPVDFLKAATLIAARNFNRWSNLAALTSESSSVLHSTTLLETSQLLSDLLAELEAKESKIVELRDRGINAVTAEELLANRGTCDQEVYANGKSVCLVGVPKDTAEIICRGISEATGCKVDWHYVGGRVHIKAIAPPAPAVPDFKKLARELVENLVDCGGAEDSSIKQYLKWTEKTCRAAMLAQPVSQGWGKLNSPEIPDGWIACKDRMPEPYEPVLYFAAGAHGGVDCCASTYNGFYDGDLWMQDATLTSLDESPALRHEIIVTHWMSLPAAPKVKK